MPVAKLGVVVTAKPLEMSQRVSGFRSGTILSGASKYFCRKENFFKLEGGRFKTCVGTSCFLPNLDLKFLLKQFSSSDGDN